jgi:DNA-binding MarR family transcriptional regulator
LDPAIQQPTKLAVVAFLSGCAEAEFKAVRDHLSLSDSALSKSVSALESAEFLKVRKGYVGKRPRTWLALTASGRTRLADHLAALQAIAEQARQGGAGLG